ncbi:MAG: ABC transporter ATP-binding protein/permease [Firmicutes bacterium]|nr:ABC transporter ATP-binding protein/permease [Bacillota bacterium]
MSKAPQRPGGRAPNTGEKPKDFKGTAKKLIKILGEYKFTLMIVFSFAVLSTVFAIVGPKILGMATTRLFEDIMGMIAGTATGIDFGYIGQIILILIGLYIVSATFSYIQGYLMAGVAMKITHKLRERIFDKIHKLPIGYYDKKSHGDVLSHLTNDVDAVSQSLSNSITQIITSVTMLLGITIMMFTISWEITLVTLATLPISFLILAFIMKRSQKHFVAQQKHLGLVNGLVEEMYGNHTLVKAFNGQAQARQEFDEKNNVLYKSAWKSQFFTGLMMPIMLFIGNISYVIVCIMGGSFAAAGRIAVGDIQAFIQYVQQFHQPVAQVANIGNVLQQTLAASERVFTFLEEKDESVETAESKKPEKLSGGVEFRQVKFGYTPDKEIIHNFSVKVKPGQKVAIVGPTGAGKTTLVKLLMRFYDINSGEILVDGVNINDYKRNDLRANFGMVLQDAWLYNDTICNNIKYGRPDADKEMVLAASAAAQSDHFIRTLPDGYNMILNEESSNVSAGERQLLTIARALITDPKIMILDEATSSVDTRTELLIQKAMDNLIKNRTSFIIAHRLSTIRNADVILVLNEGDIVEQGTHDELLAKGGFYAELYNSQFKHGIIEE